MKIIYYLIWSAIGIVVLAAMCSCLRDDINEHLEPPKPTDNPDYDLIIHVDGYQTEDVVTKTN